MNNNYQTIKKRLSSVDKAVTPRSAWNCVQLARDIKRPGTMEYIHLLFDDFMELHGDRAFGDDPAMIGGIALFEGRPVTVIGIKKGSNLKENLDCNHGMSRPEGYRKALRLAKQAEKFHRPLISFIDTPGAYPGIDSEERGIGEAIAKNLREFALLKIPTISFIIGEGGSGGALGIGITDKIYLLENAVYSVITPEGFASILLHDPSKAEEAADIMKMTSRDLLALKIINGIIPEVEEGAQADPDFTAQAIRETIRKDLDILCKKNKDSLVRYRLKKIRSIGADPDQHEWWQPLLLLMQKIESTNQLS
ncbi:MAG: acetyl-CoA carboxylase carboxyltransferase subunit alpha [Spirochaetia bacterium]|jgi:acetyl-CoA carboxylase carboxyl transferase subunit alpha|nr:acetyl-CoA carboxylase carboxyltransferase subunit alpha [Spirochaetia bacterium]